MKEGVIPSYSETCPQFETEVPNTSLFIPLEKLSTKRQIVNRTIRFAGDISRITGEQYLEGLSEYQEALRNIQNSIVLSILRRHSLHLPKFEIHDIPSGEAFLDSVGYADEPLDPSGLMLVFNTPHFSSAVWRRINDESKKEDKKRVSKSIWNRLGNSSTKVFWQISDDYSSKDRLRFRRLNEIGDHQSDRFYYLFEVTKPERHQFITAQFPY